MTVNTNCDDHAEVYRFRLWNWSLEDGQAIASVMMNWQDCTGEYFPGEEYGWDYLLREAAGRITNARYNKMIFPPVTVRASS